MTDAKLDIITIRGKDNNRNDDSGGKMGKREKQQRQTTIKRSLQYTRRKHVDYRRKKNV